MKEMCCMCKKNEFENMDPKNCVIICINCWERLLKMKLGNTTKTESSKATNIDNIDREETLATEDYVVNFDEQFNIDPADYTDDKTINNQSPILEQETYELGRICKYCNNPLEDSTESWKTMHKRCYAKYMADNKIQK